MNENFLKQLSQELAPLRNSALYREMKTVESAQGNHLSIDGKQYVQFCSNDYLGLASHPELIQAAAEAAQQYGFGAGASRMISGNMTLHDSLERGIAAFKGTEDCIVFPTGYMANVGTISSLAEQDDTVIVDKLCHASIIDGCRLSGARLRVYPHCNLEKLERILEAEKKSRRRLIITDSVFSMDGDIAPLQELVDLAEEYDAAVMVDDAHGTGVLGEQGKGAAELLGVEDRIDVLMGTLSKAVGSLGGFVCGRKELIEFLRNRARSFIYTTALPPSVCAAAIKGLDIIKQRPELRQQLWSNTEFVRQHLEGCGFDLGQSATPILPVIVGKPELAMKLSASLFEKGILIPAVRPPTVPAGTSRLRLTITAAHSQQDLDILTETLQQLI